MSQPWLLPVWVNEGKSRLPERDSHVGAGCLHPTCPANYPQSARLYTPPAPPHLHPPLPHLVISGIKQACSACLILSSSSFFFLIALIASRRFEDYLPPSLPDRISRQKADMSTTMAPPERRSLRPLLWVRGISTQLLRTEYQVTAGKTFVVPRRGDRGIWLRSGRWLVGCGCSHAVCRSSASWESTGRGV